MIITTAQLASYSGVKTSESDRVELFGIYIGAAEQAVFDYLGYDPNEQDYVHRLGGDGSLGLQLRARPVSSIKSVTISGQTLNPALLFAEREFLSYKDGITCWPKCESGIVVTYTAGWDAMDMPAAIKLAVLQIAALKLAEEGGNLAVTSKSFGDAGNRTFQNTTNHDKFLKALDNLCLMRF
jgi:hypothetical protein